MKIPTTDFSFYIACMFYFIRGFSPSIVCSLTESFFSKLYFRTCRFSREYLVHMMSKLVHGALALVVPGSVYFLRYLTLHVQTTEAPPNSYGILPSLIHGFSAM